MGSVDHTPTEIYNKVFVVARDLVKSATALFVLDAESGDNLGIV